MTSFYDRHIMPRLIGCACAAGPIMKQRAKVVPKARGRVLELGVGGGLNLAVYDPSRVDEVIGLDPSAELRAMAEQAPRAEGLSVRTLEGVGEALPFDSGAFDTVVCTFTLCTVHRPEQTLAEAHRVLKPGGRFLFCEHGLAPDAGVALWQRRLEPLWKPLAGGCHITRPIAAGIARAGFVMEWTDSMYLPNTPRILGWNEWGAARLA